jgi:hypothetical protein
MPKTPETAFGVVKARARWLDTQLRDVRRNRVRFSTPPKDPEKAQKWRAVPTAVTACLAEERRLRKEMDDTRLELVVLAETERQAGRVLTDAERAAALSALIVGASEDELDAVLEEWLRRRRYRMWVDDSGTMHVAPLGEKGATLRVVS